MPCPLSLPSVPEPLVQIRRRCSAAVGGVRLVVESGAGGWTAQVIDHGRVLYSAQRYSLAAAQAAATEFVAFGMNGQSAAAISWTESW